jgi:hypothetical protein
MQKGELQWAERRWAAVGKGMSQRVFVDGRNMFDARTLAVHGFIYQGIGR